MKRLKFLHCADIHLDVPFSSLSSSSGRSSVRRQDLKETFQKIIYLANEQAVDILLICGDLFEHEYVKRSTINFINDSFKEIPLVKVFIIPGNHDPYVNNSYYRSFNWEENVCIMSWDRPYIVLEELGACIYGAGFNSFLEVHSLIDGVKAKNTHMINILLTHGTVDMDIGSKGYNPMNSCNLAEMGMDYIALGHFHNRMDDIGGYGYIYNPGSPEPIGFDEAGKHGVLVGEISKDDMGETALDIQFFEIGKRFYTNKDVWIDGCNTNEQIIMKILSALQSHDMEKGLFTVVLKGYIETGFNIDIQQILAFFEDKCFFMRIKNESAPDYNFDRIKSEDGLRGLYTRKILERIEKSTDQHEKRLLTKALYFGIQALDSGNVEIN